MYPKTIDSAGQFHGYDPGHDFYQENQGRDTDWRLDGTVGRSRSCGSGACVCPGAGVKAPGTDPQGDFTGSGLDLQERCLLVLHFF